MLLEQELRVVGKSGVIETARATIKATPKIFSFFADQTYANKPKAICRELVANGVDSHVMSGKPDLPVEVWLPTLVDPIFKVRDFGLGMSHEFMMTGFMAYTDGSTKDNSNIAIGGFGIGSKSPFAYVDQYTIKSVFDGTVCVYSVFKDEDGMPSISLLGRKSTDESNGVEVSFPVEVSDFELFREAAFDALKYFDPLPIIRNGGQNKFEAPEYAASGKTWGMRKTAGPLQVIMGGVMYPVDPDALTYKFSDDVAKKMLRYGLDVRVPIGTCSIALSREALSYDERTVKGLTDACLSVVGEVSASFSTMFDQHPTLWDAKQALQEEVMPTGSNRHYGAQSVRGTFLADRALYRGQKLTTFHEFLVPGGMSIWDLDPATYRRSGTTCPTPKWEHLTDRVQRIQPGAFEHVIIDDLPSSPKSKAVMKIRAFITENLKQEKRTLIVRPTVEGTPVKVILEALGNPTVHTLASSLPEPVASTVPGMGIRPKVRMFTYNGHKKYTWAGSGYHDSLMPGTHGKEGITEIEYKDQPATGILVVLEKWKPPHDFYKKIDLGLVTLKEVHFVNAMDAPKLDEVSWPRFETVFQERLQAKLASVVGLGESLAVEQAMEYKLRKLFGATKFTFPTAKQQKSAFAKLEALFRMYVGTINADNRKYGPFVNVKLPNGADPAKLEEEFGKKSPRALRILQLLDYRITDDEDMSLFLDNL